MTIEDGSSLSQSETHLSVFRNFIEEDCDMLRDVINTRLLPRMVAHGFPVEGLTFKWDYSVDYTPEQQLAYETMLLNHFEIDADYFIEKYGVPVGERAAQACPPPPMATPPRTPSPRPLFSTKPLRLRGAARPLSRTARLPLRA